MVSTSLRRTLLRALPFDLRTALLLTCATRNSMRWMLQAAGIPATGLRGDLQAKGLTAVWLWGLRAWERDESADLSQTRFSQTFAYMNVPHYFELFRLARLMMPLFSIIRPCQVR